MMSRADLVRRRETQGLDGGDVEQRADLELGRDAVILDIDADQHVGSRQHGHLGMTHLVRLPARHDQPERLEWSLSQEICETFVRS